MADQSPNRHSPSKESTMGADLTGRTVVITGASGALGSAITRRFVEHGVRAVALVDIDETSVRAAAQAVSKAAPGVDVFPVALDVTDHDAVLARYAEIAARFGRVDVAVNNAGIGAPSARIHNVLSEDFRRVLDVNLMGIFHCMKASILQMRTSGGGAIVNTASVAGFTTWTHSSPYGASKAGVIQLTKTAAAEYAKEGIRVNCVCPGTFVTRFHDDLPDGALDDIRNRHPLGRFGTPDEIAMAYIYLAGFGGDWITGTSLVIDGGMSVG
jgi:NAD(P)-dependent dehydrogenase (short-subunit alcohol dehydrogenase family)